jgi:uncharacterized membrane protein YdjX (TVP38/TMEM64 family)
MFDLHRYFNFEAFKDHQNFLEGFIGQNFLLSLLIYVVLYIVIVSLSIPGASFMTLIGGFLLGQWVGTISAVIAATIGATILFLSAKMASSDLFSQKSASWVGTMQKGFQRNAFSYLLTLRLIPIFPFVLVNLAAAFFQIPIRTFCLGTFIGIIPGSFVYVSIGVAFREVIQQPEFSPNIILDPKILIALTGLGILSLLPVVYNHFKKRS